MPIYEYHCEACSKEFERFQKISDAPLTNCPDCTCKVKRIVSRTSFSLKGSGWYKDGYSSKAADKPKTDDKPKADNKPKTNDTPKPKEPTKT